MELIVFRINNDIKDPFYFIEYEDEENDLAFEIINNITQDYNKDDQEIIEKYGGSQYDNIIEPLWNNKNSTQLLTQTLNEQVKYNLATIRKQIKYCADNRKTNNYWCSKFLSIYMGYSDLFVRDEIAMNNFYHNYDYSTYPYAVVFLYNNIYYGHVYTWSSPTKSDLVLMMGIRNRVDTTFIRYNNIPNVKDIKNVSHILLEGVRRFAVIKGYKHIAAVNPFNVMIQIFEQFGGHEIPLSLSDVGIGIATSDPDNSLIDNFSFDYCYQLDDLSFSIVNHTINFYLLEH